MKCLKLLSAFFLGNVPIYMCYESTTTESISLEQGMDDKITPLVIGWIEKPPYTTSPTNQSLDNEVQGILRDSTIRYIMVDCGEYKGVEYEIKSWKLESEFGMIELLRQNKVHIALPVFENPDKRQHGEFPFFKLDDYPGTEFLKFTDDSTAVKVAMKSVLKSWPLLAVTLVLTAIAGIIIWALDTYWNSEEFPRSFFRGSWDGFWWSFVSMTTVGYGDKSPKSIVARIFSIIWIMSGLIIMAIFTANITSALTTASLDVQPSSLRGYKVGVLGNGTEFQHAEEEDAHPTEYHRIEDIIQAMSIKEVDGMMLNYYTASYYQKRDKLKSLITVKVFDLRRDVGALFSKDKKNLAYCLMNHRANIWRLVQTHTVGLKLKQQKSTKTVGLLDDSSLIVNLYISLGVLSGLILAGTLWEFCVRKKAKIKSRDAVEDVLKAGITLMKPTREAIRCDVEAARELFKQMEEHLSQLESKVSKL